MDDGRFDTLARIIGSRTSRRAALGLATTGLFAIAVSEVEALGCSKQKPCPACQRCRRRRCKPDATQDGASCDGGTCQQGVCTAAPVTCDQVCDGCCKASGRCASGTTSAACGTDGEPCETCTGDEVCNNGDCVVLPCGKGGVCRVFVTSTEHTGNLGGLQGADTICQQRAQAAGLPGTYKSWLSDDTDSPATRFVNSPGPYRLVDGTQVASSYGHLTLDDGGLDAPINRTETGALVDEEGVPTWTNTRARGTRISDDHCANWTSSSDSALGIIGDGNDTLGNNWTFIGSLQCSSDFVHLYCFQQS